MFIAFPEFDLFFLPVSNVVKPVIEEPQQTNKVTVNINKHVTVIKLEQPEEAEVKPEVKPEVKSDLKTDVKHEVKLEAKTEVKIAAEPTGNQVYNH